LGSGDPKRDHLRNIPLNLFWPNGYEDD
jgi:hypothetical protein